MNSVVLLTDFSTACQHAALYAARLTLQYKSAKLVLCCTHEAALFNNSETLPDTEARKNAVLEKLKQLHRRLLPYIYPLTSIRYRCETGTHAAIVNKVAIEEYASLVITGLNMDGDKRQWLTGFETQNVPDTCLCPVLLVPGQTAITAITKIVFACDLEDMQDTIEQSGLLNILNNLQARLIVLHVDKPGKASSTAAVQQLPVIQHLLRPYKPSYFYLENELPQMAIARFTREHDASIVMIVRKRKGLFSKLFHASLTRSLAVETAVPMLILHATKNYPVRKI